MKLIESKPNIVAGTSYANLKECLLKIERSGYLDCIIKNVDQEVSGVFIILAKLSTVYNINSNLTFLGRDIQ